jgi:hypothetical protein
MSRSVRKEKEAAEAIVTSNKETGFEYIQYSADVP